MGKIFHLCGLKSLKLDHLGPEKVNCVDFLHLCFLCPKVVLLSATMPADVLEVTKKFMRDPIRILVKKEELTLEGIRQFYINVEKEVNRVVFEFI